MTGNGSGHAAWMPSASAGAPVAVESLVGYSDLHQIGAGGDSVVYRAREDTLGRDVAIKVLDVDDESRAARFAREVEITLDLGRQHPNIVTVLATGITGSGRPAIVMEFYPEGTLHDRLKEFGPLPVDEVVRIGLVLADALSFAHDRGVLHRDVKPQNVLVLPTSWVLADFGIARLVDSEHTGSVETFTYRHASPQVLDGHAPTAADDVWSVGSTLYTLVDGRPPFASDDPEDDSALAYLRRARIEPHRPLGVPGTEDLAAIIDRCLVKEVDGRWPSADALHDALLGLRHRAWEPVARSTAPTPPTPDTADTPEPAQAPLATGPAPGPGLSDAADPAPADAPAPMAAEAAEPIPAADADHTGRAWAPPPAPVATTAAVPRTPSNPSRPDVESDTPAASVSDEEPWDRPPAPVALSAAAQVPVIAAVDAEPTGMGLPEQPRSAPPEVVEVGRPEEASPARTRRRRLVIALGVVALLAGTALGVAGSVLRDDDPPEAPAVDDSLAGQPIPELAERPEETDPRLAISDPALAFEFLRLTYESGNIIASWQDPSDGEAFFHLSEVSPDENYVQIFDYGQTEAEFPYQLGLGRTCFVMVLHMPDQTLGVSNQQRCLRNGGG